MYVIGQIPGICGVTAKPLDSEVEGPGINSRPSRSSSVSFSANNSKLAPILGHARRLIRRLRHILNIAHELIIRCEEGNKIILYIGSDFVLIEITDQNL